MNATLPTTATLPTRPAPPAFAPLPCDVDAPAPTRREKAIQTTRARAATLTAQGYRIAPLGTGAGFYSVTTPERLDRKTGELYVIDYTVDVIGQTCNCPMFEQHGLCKHLVATRAAVAEALRLAEGMWATR